MHWAKLYTHNGYRFVDHHHRRTIEPNLHKNGAFSNALSLSQFFQVYVNQKQKSKIWPIILNHEIFIHISKIVPRDPGINQYSESDDVCKNDGLKPIHRILSFSKIYILYISGSEFTFKAKASYGIVSPSKVFTVFNVYSKFHKCTTFPVSWSIVRQLEMSRFSLSVLTGMHL